MDSIVDLLVLSRIPAIGSNRLRALVSHFGTPANVLRSGAREISVVEGFTRELASRVASLLRQPSLDVARRYAERQLSRLNSCGGRVLTFWDPDYPDALRKIYDAPGLLFVRGEILEDDRYSVAIVGTRSPSAYGIAMAEKFSAELVRVGIAVASGLARGIDTASHEAVVKGGGRTLAVIGSGLDRIYPPENRGLAERIVQHGAVISEYEMGAAPEAGNFPRRNRIISGLTLGTIVIETDLTGGAMITAGAALEQNREVFAVPGNIGAAKSRGCNALIRDGRAKLVENLEDIVAELEPKLRPMLKGAFARTQKVSADLTLFEQSIFDLLSAAPAPIDAIAVRAGMSASDALANLISLESKGFVTKHPGGSFSRA